jgi:ribonuclease P protein component
LESPLLSSYVAPRYVNGSRVAIIVGSSVSKKATVRNSLRRILQEAFAKTLPKGRGVDMIVYPKKGIVNLGKEEMRKEAEILVRKTNV